MQPWSSPAASAILVAYDCPADQLGERRRRQLRRHCAPHLERVQYSVYLGHLPRSDIADLERRLCAEIEPAHDRLLVADLAAGEWRSHGLGMPMVRLPPAALAVVARHHEGLARAARAAEDRAARRAEQRAADPVHAAAPPPRDPGPCEQLGRRLDAWLDTCGFRDWLQQLGRNS